MTGRAPDDVSVPGGHHVCLVVPNGTHAPGRWLERCRAPSRRAVGAVWCGDPQLRRPRAVSGGGRRRGRLARQLLSPAPPPAAEWRRALLTARVAARRRARRRSRCCGSGPSRCSTTCRSSWDGVTTMHASCRGRRAAARRRCSPTEATWSTARAVQHARGACSARTRSASSTGSTATWPSRGPSTPTAPAGRSLARARRGALRRRPSASTIGSALGAWRWDTDRPALLDVGRSTRARRGCSTRPSVDRRGSTSSVDPIAVGALDRAAEQVAGRRSRSALPGGIARRHTVAASRSGRILVVRGRRRHGRHPAAFRRWLEDRYWPPCTRRGATWPSRFPEPVVRDADAFERVVRRAFVDDDVRLARAADPPGDGRIERFVDDRRSQSTTASTSSATSVASRASATSPAGCHRPGRGRGAVTRCWPTNAPPAHSSPTADHQPTSRLRHDAGGRHRRPVPAPRRSTTPSCCDATTADDRLLVLGARAHPAGMRARCSRSVDEIWAGSRFVADAFAAVADDARPPRPDPDPGAASRRHAAARALPPLAGRRPLRVPRRVRPSQRAPSARTRSARSRRSAGLRSRRGAAAGDQVDERRTRGGRSTSR